MKTEYYYKHKITGEYKTKQEAIQDFKEHRQKSCFFEDEWEKTDIEVPEEDLDLS